MKSCWVPACYIRTLFKGPVLFCCSGAPGGDTYVGLPAGPGVNCPPPQKPLSSPVCFLHVSWQSSASQSVWFSQKQEDLPGHWRNVKGLTADYFFLSILTGRVGWIFILCCPKGWAPFSSQKASLQLTRAIFRLQCPTSDFWSKDIYIHLCV